MPPARGRELQWGLCSLQELSTGPASCPCQGGTRCTRRGELLAARLRGSAAVHAINPTQSVYTAGSCSVSSTRGSLSAGLHSAKGPGSIFCRHGPPCANCHSIRCSASRMSCSETFCQW